MAKLREARFFLDLLERVESSAECLLPASTVDEEISYLLSAFLSAVYATTEQLKSIAGVEAVKAFKEQHPLTFGSKNGLRNLTIHERHISPTEDRYVPQAAADLVFSEPATSSSDLVFQAEYYVWGQGEVHRITTLCGAQYAQLAQFAAAQGATVA